MSQNQLSKQTFGKKITVFLLLTAIFVNTALAAPDSARLVFISSNEMAQDLRFGWISLGSGNGFFGLLSLIKPLGGSSDARPAPVKVEILQGEEITLRQGEPVNFAAIALAANGSAVSGLKFDWTIQNTDRANRPKNLPNGTFLAERVGNYVVTAKSQGLQAQITVRVEENLPLTTLKNIKDQEARGNATLIKKLKQKGRYKTDDISSKRDYASERNNSQPALQESESAEKGGPKGQKGGPNAEEAESSGSFVGANAKSRMMARPLLEDGWGPDNWWMADDPGNQTGTPPGTSPDAGAGNGNFQLSAPVVTLPGRGIDINLSLNYNSRVWSKSGNLMSFDAERGYPAPGWNLGFGKMMYMGSGGGCMLVDADGTHRGYTGSVSSYTYGNYSSMNFAGYTTDGTFIDYSCYVSTYNGVTSMSGYASLPNGRKITYFSPSANGKQAFPTQISDSQGNYISIYYRNYRGPSIQTITDTLGRVITFNYDSMDRLISVDVPKMDNAGTRTAVRLHYRQIALNPGWAYGIYGDTNNPYPYVVDAIYYPGTNTGYWFGADPNANDFAEYYSSYGMLAKITEHRGMSWTGNPGEQGTVVAGTMSKQAVYNYPLQPDYTLTDAPTFSTMTESWAGMDTDAAVTSYNLNMNSSPRTITVTQPNGVKSKQYMNNAPGQWYDGLLFKDETLDTANNILSKSEVTWEQGNYSSARPVQTIATDEKQQSLKTTYSYLQNGYQSFYNQVTSQKHYDYDGTTVLKEIRNSYENSPLYTGRHIFSLVKSSEIYDGDGNRISKTDYEYDNNAVQNGTGNPDLKANPGITMHFSTFDPFTTETMDGPTCNSWHLEQQWCDDGGGYGYWCYIEVCNGYEQVSVYDPNSIFRGNLTKTTVYTDAGAATPTGAITQTKKYDTAGNLVSEAGACCEMKTNEFTVATQYAYPTSRSQGSSDPNSPIRNTVTAVFDFNTGLIKRSTNANGKTVTTTYNPETLRASQTTSSTGAYSISTYNDAEMSVTNETFEAGGALASKGKTFLNGVGMTKREEAAGLNNTVDIVETQYTKLRQVWKKSRPYRSGGTIHWTETAYDLLGRATEVTEPDGSKIKAFYNEAGAPAQSSGAPGETVRNVDAWGRERWGRKDALGRLAEVVEPKPDGNGAFATSGNLSTTYSYDALGKLILSDQGGQIRKFKYDSLGRMTRQKLAEQVATISDAGDYVGGGSPSAKWSGAVSYDSRSNIVRKVDARGVKTNYSYQIGGADDPLNRIQEISYDLSGPRDTSKPITAASDVSYQYETAGDQTRIKRIRTNGFLTEDFTYEAAEGRLHEYTQRVDYRSDFPWTTTYAYDSLDRVTQIRLPAQYGITGNPRKLTENTYGIGGRLANLKVEGQQVAGDIDYNELSQITSMKVGTAGTNQVTENYSFDLPTGLLSNQKAIRNGTTLLDLSYDYTRNNSIGNTAPSWKTGAVTKIINNLDHAKDREYQYDALGRLTAAKGKDTNQWQQLYTYDRYGNRLSVAASGQAANNSAIPTDGLPSLSYENASNRISTPGFEYDSAGNQTRALAEDGVTWLRYEYDAANRLHAIRKDDAGQTLLQAFQYSSTNARLIDYSPSAGVNTFYLNIGGKTIAEYKEYLHTIPTWTKSNIYLGDRLLSSITPNGSGGETTEYSHPDKLGTRLITNQVSGTALEQAHLPFGTALNAESTIVTNTRRFTSYERSPQTGLDYAQNRTYDSKQGRFTQVDPIGMAAVSIENPQSLNLYNYVGNDPINRTDPTGLFWGAIGRFFKKLLRIIALVVIAVVLVVVAIVAPFLLPPLIAKIVAWASLAIAAMIAFKLGSEFIGSIKEWLNRCNVPDYAGLSQARKDELAQRGVTPDQWNNLKNKQRLGYFNITAAMAAAGLSLAGWLVDWGSGGIQQDRVKFIRGATGGDLLAQVRSSSIFTERSGSYRLNTIARSTELTFSSNGMRLEVDIDIFNPYNIGLPVHLFEVAAHKLGRFFGGGTRTNPYNVAYRASWECK